MDKPKKKYNVLGKDRRVAFGPRTITAYSHKAFSHITREHLETAWQLVGPTIERNIDRPLWMQFAAAYYEGLNHGSAMERELAREPAAPEVGIYW